MKITFPHINGPFDGFLRFTELEGVSRITKEDDFVTKKPQFKAWAVVICYIYRGPQRAIRFPSVEARNLTYNKVLTRIDKGLKEVTLTSEDFTLPSMTDEQAFNLLRQQNLPKDFLEESAKVFGPLEACDAFRPFLNFGNPYPAIAGNLELPEYAAELFTLTLPVPRRILSLGITRKQYFTFKCSRCGKY